MCCNMVDLDSMHMYWLLGMGCPTEIEFVGLGRILLEEFPVHQCKCKYAFKIDPEFVIANLNYSSRIWNNLIHNYIYTFTELTFYLL